VRLDEAALGSARVPVLAPRPAVVHSEPADHRRHYRVEITRWLDLRRHV